MVMKSAIAAVVMILSLVPSAPTRAADVRIPGKKLVIRNGATGSAGNRLVFLAKSSLVPAPQGNAQFPTADGGYLHVSGDGGDFRIDLPTAGWLGRPAVSGVPRRAKYRDPTGATCRIVILIDGALEKAVCVGPQVAFALGAAQGPIDVIIGTGTQPLRRCHRFGSAAPESCDVLKDGSNGRVYLAKNCAGAPVACASPSGAFLDDVHDAF
jgi:hypothetical protein